MTLTSSQDQRGEMKKAIKAVAAAEGLVESKDRSVAAENTNVVQHQAKESGAGSKQAGAGKTPPRNVKAAGPLHLPGARLESLPLPADDITEFLGAA